MINRHIAVVLLPIVVILSTAASMGAAFLPNIFFLIVLFCVYKRGGTIKRVSINSGIAAAILGAWIMASFLIAGNGRLETASVFLSILLSILIVIVFAGIGLLYGWLLGVAMGKHSTPGKG